jgi:hypothetical protein
MVDATLVTVRGFWSSPSTWDRLRAVWGADEELKGLRIHGFGRIPGHPDGTAEGRHRRAHPRRQARLNRRRRDAR